MEIKAISADETYNIRHQVLWPEKTIEEVKISGDENALHLGAFILGKHVGVISLFIEGKQAQFRKFAVLEDFQGRGIGQLLLQKCIALASKHNAESLWCDARQDVTDFYKKQGFDIDPAVFFKSGIPYQKAFRKIKPKTTYSLTL